MRFASASLVLGREHTQSRDDSMFFVGFELWRLKPLYLRTSVNPRRRLEAIFRLTAAIVPVLAAMLAGTTYSHAQGIPTSMGPEMPGAPIATRGGATIHVTVLDEDKKPLKQQALIRVTSQATGMVFFQTTRASEATFPDLPVATYLIEAGAAGYLGTHGQIAITDAAHDVNETVILLPDPASVDLRLKDAAQIPTKARKEAEKGLQALELSDFLEARKHLEAANHQYSSSSSINFLLGYLALQQKDPDRELKYLTAAIKLDPTNIQAQNLLGQLYYQRGDYVHAAEAEEIVVASNGESLMARKVLANSYLKLKQFEKARENSEWIVEKGGSEGASARLVLGQALAGLHRNQAAIQTLKVYLDGEQASSVAPQVRKLITQLEREESQGTDAAANIGIGDPELNGGESGSDNAGMPSDEMRRSLRLRPVYRVPPTYWN